ncbi:MAG: serpin family protein [Nodosilinea sp.]
MVLLCNAIAPQPEMVIDRPFLAAVRDRQSGTLLFLSAIADPR